MPDRVRSLTPHPVRRSPPRHPPRRTRQEQGRPKHAARRIGEGGARALHPGQPKTEVRRVHRPGRRGHWYVAHSAHGDGHLIVTERSPAAKARVERRPQRPPSSCLAAASGA